MTAHPSTVKSDYQLLLDEVASQADILRRPMTTRDVARITASSLRLAGIETTAAELYDRYGPSGE
jgi:hypothetical protein